MNRSPGRSRGFTLLEILIAMTLFTILGLGVVLLMSTGVDMWLQGTRASFQEDQAEEGWPRLVDDLRHVLVPTPTDRIPFDPKNPDPEKIPPALPPVNRFLSGYVFYPFGDQQVLCRYIAFVRDISGLPEVELFDARAGRSTKADAYIDGKNDDLEFKQSRHLPTGGSVEVLWIWLPRAAEMKGADTTDDDLGIGTVYRAYRSPIGGKDTLLDPANFDSLRKVRKIIQPQPMLENVTLFDAYFWTQFTTTWEWTSGEPRVVARPQDPEQAKSGRPACGPSRTWDSTRGILVGSSGVSFRLNKGKESFNYSADDIWPRIVRIELARAEEKTVLVEAFSSTDQSFRLDSPDFAMGRGELYGQSFKVGAEWLTVAGRDGNLTDVIIKLERGVRGTSALAHAAFTPVYYGRLVDHDVLIPSFRDDNN